MSENTVVSIPIDKLTHFEGRALNLYKGQWLDSALKAETFNAFGKSTPIVVRPIEDGKYEILQGVNRVAEAQLLGLPEISAFVMNGITDEEARLIVTGGNHFVDRIFDTGEIRKILYMQNELSQKGAYYIDTHTMRVSLHENTPRGLIILIHEIIHTVMGEMLVGYLIGDLFLTTDLILKFLDDYRIKCFMGYFRRIEIADPVEMQIYMFENAYELDVVLSQKDDYVKLVRRCVRLFETYQYMHTRMRSLTEGMATFLSLKLSEGIAEKTEDMQFIKAVQREKDVFLTKYNDEASSTGYFIAQSIYDKYGLDGLIVSAVASTAIPYYNFDLIGCSDIELIDVLESFYNCDKRWLNFYLMDSDVVDETISTVDADPFMNLEKLGCKLCGVDYYPERQKEYLHTPEYWVNCIVHHPLLLSELSALGYKAESDEFFADDKYEYESTGNLDGINTYGRFWRLFLSLLGDKNIHENGSPPHDGINADPQESLEKKLNIETKINTLQFILRYHRLIDDDNLKNLINCESLISKSDIAKIREYSEMYK